MRTLFARIILPYAVFASLWILLSDWFVEVWIADEAERTRVSIYKGWAFVLITSLLLYLLMRLELALRNRAEARATDSEQRSHETQQWLELAVRGSRVGLWDWNLATNAVYLSPEWKHQLGYEDAELPNVFDSWESRIHPDDHARAMDTLKACIESCSPDFELECRLRHKDGSYRWILARGVLKLGPDCQPQRLLGCHIDITDRKKTEEAMEAAKVAAEAANQAKDRFLASLSHELRTPLTPVLACLSSLEGDPALPGDLGRDIAMMRRNVEMEARIIDDLLDLTRIAHGKVQLEMRTADAHELIRHAIDICHDSIVARRLVLNMALDAPRYHVHADSARLEQVFWNVLRNAVKFTPEGGAISVGSSNDASGSLKVEIADTGVGIAPESLLEVFDAFQQAHTASQGKPAGLGLGLAISKALVELQGGTILAASEGSGKGATITILLPTREPEPVVLVPLPLPPPQPTDSLRILLVEDDPTTATVLARLLHRTGHRVVTAGTVSTAVKIGLSQPFDLLLSDIGLPDGTGLEVMRELKSQRGLKGIALSGYGMDADVRNSQDAGFAIHLVKPVDFRSLTRVIREVCTP